MTVQAVRDALAVPKPKTEANDVRWKKWAAAQLVVQHHTPAALDSLEAERDAALDRCQLYGDALGAEENNSAALEAERDALKEDRTKIEARLAEVNDQRDEMQRQALVSLNRSDAAAARIRELEAEVERLQLRDRPAVLAMTEEWKAMETALAAAQEENERLAASLGTSVKTSLAQRTALREAEEENERLKADALTRSVREDEVDEADTSTRAALRSAREALRGLDRALEMLYPPGEVAEEHCGEAEAVAKARAHPAVVAAREAKEREEDKSA